MKRNQYSNWREDLREIVDMTSSDPKDQSRSEKEITDKKVKNKIVINPVMGEAIEALGGTILEFVELGEQEEDQDREKDKARQSQIRHQQQMMAKQQMLDRQRLQMQKQGKLPIGHMEEVEQVDESQIEEGLRRRLAAAGAAAAVAAGGGGAAKAGEFSGKANLRVGSTPAKATDKSVSSAVDKALANKGTSHSASSEKGKTGVTGSGSIKYSGSVGSSAKKKEKPEVRSTITPKPSSDSRTSKPREKSSDSSRPSSESGRPSSNSGSRGTRTLRMGDEYQGELIDEKITAKTDMGDVIKDFYKSDAPQFKGKSKEKRRQMAIAAKLTAERGGRKLGESTVPGKPAEKLKTDRKMFTISPDEREAARDRLLAKAKARRESKKIDEATRVERERGQDPSKSSRAAAAISSLARAKTPFLKQKHKEDFPGSRQPKKVPGAKETEGQAAARRRGAQAERAAKHGLTSKEKKETQSREKYYSSRD